MKKESFKNSKKFNIPIPRFCIFSVTWECNLDCVGCYAKDYTSNGSLNIVEINIIANQVSDLGCFVSIIAGGEPMMVPNLISTLSEIKSSLFLLFTNGTLINENVIDQFKKTKNILPIISIEGDANCTDERRGNGVSEKILESMRMLDDSQVGFGFSAMATHKNLNRIISRDWLDEQWEHGARFGFIIDYIPFKNGLDASLILQKKIWFKKRLKIGKRNNEAKPLLFNLPPDEYNGDGCQSAGKGLIHINADGFVEPSHFLIIPAGNIKEKRLEEILASQFFKEIRNKIR